MAAEVTIFGRIRKLLEGLDAEPLGERESQLVLTPQLELLTAQGTAPYSEIVRVGRAFYVNTVTAIAAIVATPTTAQMLSMYNNEPDGGRSCVIDWVSAQNVVSTAVASQATLLFNIGQVREAVPTGSALTIKKLNGLGGGVDSRVLTILNATALPGTTGVAANWFSFGPTGVKTGAAATPGYGIWVPVDGKIIVPPGRYFATHVLANVVGETFIVAIGWHEIQTTLG